jgi:hypothetical protein
VNRKIKGLLILLTSAGAMIAGCGRLAELHDDRNLTPTAENLVEIDDYEIVTLLPRDAIPSIDHPTFYDIEGANQEYEPDELVIGIELNGESRAYPIDLLSRHEIVNDEIQGKPIAVTW